MCVRVFNSVTFSTNFKISKHGSFVVHFIDESRFIRTPGL
jgi:hypothetical protein